MYDIWLAPLELADLRRRRSSSCGRRPSRAPGSPTASAGCSRRRARAGTRSARHRRRAGGRPTSPARPRAVATPARRRRGRAAADPTRSTPSTLRPVRHRRRQPLRPRGRPRRRRAAGQAYNPLFIYGPPGRRQDPPPHAIGTYVARLRRRPDASATPRSRRFTNEFIGALRQAAHVEALQGALPRCDVLLVDDVQFLARKARTEEEFFHTFNALLRRRQPDRPHLRPPARATCEASRTACASASSSGLVADIAPPDSPRRLADPAQARPARPRRRSADDVLDADRRPRAGQHARARGRAHPRRRLRLADRRAGSPRRSPPRSSTTSTRATRAPAAGARPSTRSRSSPRETFGISHEELALARARRPRGVAAAGRHVPRARAHGPHAAGDRPRVRRAQPHHRPPRLPAHRRAHRRPTPTRARPSTSCVAALASSARRRPSATDRLRRLGPRAPLRPLPRTARATRRGLVAHLHSPYRLLTVF